jgi:hypothetical protein
MSIPHISTAASTIVRLHDPQYTTNPCRTARLEQHSDHSASMVGAGYMSSEAVYWRSGGDIRWCGCDDVMMGVKEMSDFVCRCSNVTYTLSGDQPPRYSL